MDFVYALALGSEESPEFIYVGVTSNPDRRFQQHLAGIASDSVKPLYEYIRFDKRKNTLRMIILDPFGSCTEEIWRQTLLEEGYPLQNTMKGLTKKRSERQVNEITKLYHQINRIEVDKLHSEENEDISIEKFLAKSRDKRAPSGGDA